MRNWIGWSITATGVLHTIAAIGIFGDMIAPIVRDGFFATVGFEASAARNGAFWFFFAGFLLMILGPLVTHVERAGIGLPWVLPWSLLAFSAVGAAMMPQSGFWLLMVPIAGMYVRTRRAPSASHH